MRRKYKLGSKKFWIEVVNLNDERIDQRNARPVNAGVLLSGIISSQITHLLITATFPIVYLRTKVDAGYSQSTYVLSYRPWLGFASYLEQVPLGEEPDWVRYGF